jgi:hypothetical protein
MIHLERARSAPALLDSSEIQQFRADLAAFFARAEHHRRQERPRFPLLPEPMFAALIEDLFALSYGKCAYCESPVPHRERSLDRYRPKAGVVGLDGESSTEHYWWLAYTWENLYPACVKCNKFKGPKFPVEGPRASPRASLAELATERRLLLDPFSDEPSQHLDFQADGTVKPLSSAGDVTIATLELNRLDLVAERQRIAGEVTVRLHRFSKAGHPQRFEAIFRKYGVDSFGRLPQRMSGELRLTALEQELRAMLAPESPWVCAAYAACQRWLNTLSSPLPVATGAEATPAPAPVPKEAGAPVPPPASAQAFGTTVKQRKQAAKAQALRSQVVTRIAIHNFRGIRDLDIRIDVERGSGAPWTVFLGENGTGKSSILQAVALTLLDADSDTPGAPAPKDVLRKGRSEGSVRVWLDEAAEPRVLEFKRGARRFQRSGPVIATALLGYGATRLLPRRGAIDKRGRVRLENMFDPFRPLIDADRWLGQLDKVSFDYVARALKEVLDLPRSASLRRTRVAGVPGVKLKLHGASLSLHELSDGYQSVLGLCCDVVAGLHVVSQGALELAEGLVAIDELGAHLHPRWRMRVIGSIRRAFPRVQVLASTHDPLCLRGLENGEAAVLRRTARGRIFLVPELPPIKGLRVDELLTSEYFGLDSTMDPSIERRYRELYRLLAVHTPTTPQSERIVKLREELAPYELPGATRRERRLLAIIDKELAQVDEEPDVAKRQEIRRASEQQMVAELNLRLAAGARS